MAKRRKIVPLPPPPPKPKPKMGRPECVINWDDVAIMASNFCPYEDIAAVVRTSVSTLEKHCVRDNGITLPVYVNQRRSSTRNALRNMQMQTAMSGNVVMMIFLGKNMLGQTDKVIKYDSLWAREQDHKELLRKGAEAIAVLEEKGAIRDQD